MIQKFVELGEGYGDVYELCQLIETNKDRIHEAFIITSSKDEHKYCSLAVAFKPVGESKFMPIYICREGIPVKADKKAQRVEIFEQALQAVEKVPNTLELKHSSAFTDSALFYQYLVGILRLNHYIPPMS